MEYIVDNGIKFAKLNAKQFGALMSLEIGDLFITKAQMAEVRNVLELDGKDAEELNAIRNTIVRYFGRLTSEAITMGDVEFYTQVHNTMSGTTAVIDNLLYSMR